MSTVSVDGIEIACVNLMSVQLTQYVTVPPFATADARAENVHVERVALGRGEVANDDIELDGIASEATSIKVAIITVLSIILEFFNLLKYFLSTILLIPIFFVGEMPQLP